MHLRSILAIARKDALDILLNKSTLFMLLSPLMLAVLFLGIGKLLSSHSTSVLIYDPSRSGVEQVVKSAFSDITVTYANSPRDVSAAFGPDGSHKDAAYALGLIVPDNFDASIRAGEHPQLSLFVDGGQIGNIQRQLLLRAISDYSRNVANPQIPIGISVATINPPAPSTANLDISKIYAIAILLSSLIVGTSIVPGLLAEEKEKKTLRMLMVSPASFADVVAAKLLVGMTYQLLLTLLALAIQGGFIGQVPLLVLFSFLGALLSIAIGLVIGGFFQTTSATGAIAGMFSFIYLLPIFFVGVFTQLIPNNPFSTIIKILPTYYVASGAADAVSNQSTLNSIVLNAGVLVAIVILLFVVATWALRRQASVVGAI